MDNQLSKFIFDKVSVPTFQKFLNLSSFRHKLISGNLANIATPGYEARDVDFKAEFDRLTSKSDHVAGYVTQPNHIPLGQHEGKAPKVDKSRVQDGTLNSVDIDHETTAMVENELTYTVGARLLQGKFEALAKAIKSQ